MISKLSESKFLILIPKIFETKSSFDSKSDGVQILSSLEFKISNSIGIRIGVPIYTTYYLYFILSECQKGKWASRKNKEWCITKFIEIDVAMQHWLGRVEVHDGSIYELPALEEEGDGDEDEEKNDNKVGFIAATE